LAIILALNWEGAIPQVKASETPETPETETPETPETENAFQTPETAVEYEKLQVWHLWIN